MCRVVRSRRRVGQGRGRKGLGLALMKQWEAPVARVKGIKGIKSR